MGIRTSVAVLGVPVDDLNMNDTLDRLEAFIEDGRAGKATHQVATVNVDFVVKSLDDPELRYLLQQSSLATADGTPLFWAMRALGARLSERVAGADLVPALAGRAAAKGYSFFLLGAAPGVAEAAAEKLQARFPGLKIVGVHSPPYRPVLEMDISILDEISAARPDVLLVAFGNPKQEKWIGMHARKIGVPVMIGIGGTLDFIAGVRRRAPGWMQRLGLEWFYRLAQEPGRLWRRYGADLVLFGLAFSRQWWGLRRPPKSGCGSVDVDFQAERNFAVLRLSGCWQAGQAELLWAAGCAALEHSPEVCLALEELQWMDSTIGGTILEIARMARERGGELSVANPSPAARRLLSAIRLDTVLPVYENLREAALKLEQRSGVGSRLGGTVAAETVWFKGTAWSIIQVGRYLDTTNSPNFQDLGKQLLQSHPYLIIDLQETIMITSAGMAALISLNRLAAERGGALRITNVSSDVLRMIELVRLDRVLDLVPDMRAALA